jgi:hypothetical protein
VSNGSNDEIICHHRRGAEPMHFVHWTNITGDISCTDKASLVCILDVYLHYTSFIMIALL